MVLYNAIRELSGEHMGRRAGVVMRGPSGTHDSRLEFVGFDYHSTARSCGDHVQLMNEFLVQAGDHVDGKGSEYEVVQRERLG